MKKIVKRIILVMLVIATIPMWKIPKKLPITEHEANQYYIKTEFYISPDDRGEVIDIRKAYVYVRSKDKKTDERVIIVFIPIKHIVNKNNIRYKIIEVP